MIPVNLRDCLWQEAAFAGLKALPKDARPVEGKDWSNRDEAMTNVARGIRDVVRENQEGG